MSNYDYEDDEDEYIEDEESSRGGGRLRAMYEEELAKSKALRRELAEYQRLERQAEVMVELEARGLNPDAAGMVPDDVSGDPKRLNKWLDSNGHLIAPKGSQQAEEPAAAGDEEAAGGDPSIPGDDLAAFQKIQRTSEGGGNSTVDLAAIRTKIENCKTPEEFEALAAQYSAHGL